MNKTFFILLTSLFLFNLNIKGQDQLLFLNGKELEGKLIDKTNYEFTFKTNKKQYVIDKYRLFSFTKNSNETIIYEYDTLAGNFLSVKDMKFFVYGERDAQNTFNTNFVTGMGLVLVGTAGYFMHKEQSFIFIPAPLIYTVSTLIFPTKVRKHKLKNTSYIHEDEYLRGYERIARGKRTQAALKSSIVGMGIGFLVSLIVNGSNTN